ncbi:hypothetical protein [Thermoactinospora rubra]|uniref:hypothetical protein n=1 Tax=Thermoactinospora rubra TaxID=1088767 RepID=UPI000A10923B|nr:hypothetical protein [Thermoactinospora rubra]
MTLQLTSRTELYDRHAAGVFAYCADQLGDLGVAADALAAVLSRAAGQAPPRAALYALARREIHKRDVVYSPPVVDPLVDPQAALVERAFRELRPHQREVLLLAEVCGLDRAELAWVLDVAADTADELAAHARARFQHALLTALASAVRLADQTHEALAVTPPRELLARLPWPVPPESVRSLVRDVAPAPWPVPPVWPLPLAETDPATSTGLFPAELLRPRAEVSHHEAATAPMPKVPPLSAPMPGDVLVAGKPGSLFAPQARRREPVYYLREPKAARPAAQEPVAREAAGKTAGTEAPRRPESSRAEAGRPQPRKQPTGRPGKPAVDPGRDWAWEVLGFVVCVVIALLAFLVF